MSKQPIGERVRQLRQGAGLSQRALALKIGVSPAAIARMESEASYVTSRPTIMALAQVLVCDPDWLQDGTGHRHGQPKSPAAVARADKEMKVFLDNLPNDVRAALAESSLAGAHYLDMEWLLDSALRSRSALADPEKEAEFQGMLKRWGRKRVRGRAAIWHGIKLLELLSSAALADHAVNAATSKTGPQ